jgi:hypothetical protein
MQTTEYNHSRRGADFFGLICGSVTTVLDSHTSTPIGWFAMMKKGLTENVTGGRFVRTSPEKQPTTKEDDEDEEDWDVKLDI